TAAPSRGVTSPFRTALVTAADAGTTSATARISGASTSTGRPRRAGLGRSSSSSMDLTLPSWAAGIAPGEAATGLAKFGEGNVGHGELPARNSKDREFTLARLRPPITG